MAETCAGCIYNPQFPIYDVDQCYEFGSLGQCTDGVCMRVVQADQPDQVALPGQNGRLQLAGPAVFKEYYNNSMETAAAFSPDGWFTSGDIAFLDANGYLNIVGRAKDTININGIKHEADDIESALEEAAFPGMLPTYTKVFGLRIQDSFTESVCVVYVPTYDGSMDAASYRTDLGIAKIVQMQCGSRPARVIPLPKKLLNKTSLGKLSRAKIQKSLESGEYAEFKAEHKEAIQRLIASSHRAPSGHYEVIIDGTVAKLTGVNPTSLSVTSGVVELGVTSVEVLRLKNLLQQRLAIANVPVMTILTNPNIEGLAEALQKLSERRPFNPVVALQPDGDKTPLWLLQPGAGEVLVYMNLAKYFPDRPTFALRARGFDRNEKPFQSLSELVRTHTDHILRVQPSGPYLIVGYSYGGMLAFEVSKRIIQAEHDVKFLAVLNMPPHIQNDMRRFTRVSSLLNLALFVGLVEDEGSDVFHSGADIEDHVGVFRKVLQHSPEGRLEELGLTREQFLHWAELAYLLHTLALDYEPAGKIPCLDVFVAEPLRGVAKSRAEYRSQRLSRWQEFCNTSVRFHEVDGEHFTMLDENNVSSFQRKFKAALRARGV